MEDLSGGAQHLGRPEAAAEADPVPLAHISEADQQHLEAFPLEVQPDVDGGTLPQIARALRARGASSSNSAADSPNRWNLQ